MKSKHSTTRYHSARINSRKGKRRKLLLRALMLALCCAILLFGAFSCFTGPGIEDHDLPPGAAEETTTGIPEQPETAEDEETESLETEPRQNQGAPNSAGQPEAVGTEQRVITDGDYLLALVTKETALKSDYEPTDLLPVPGYMYPARELWLREEALRQLETLWQSAAADGVTLTIISAYRSYEYQQTLFQNYANSYGAEAANRFSARPGQSEHQLGTTVDFGGTDVDLKPAFAGTAQGMWLAANAYKFGFAMSYPEGAESVTGYIFEPWHYRYIGKEKAIQWHASELSLKEFLQAQPQFYD